MTVGIYLASVLIVCSAIPVFCVQDHPKCQCCDKDNQSHTAQSLTLYKCLHCMSVQMLITAQPSIITDGDTKTVNIRCSLEGEFREHSLPFIRIYFKKPIPSEKQLAQVTSTGASISDPALTSRATVTGEIASTTTGSFLHLDVISNITCSDVGTYFCRSQYIDENGTHPLEASSTIEGKSYPKELEVRHEPLKAKYPVGEQVKIVCWGKVGKPAVDWAWQEYDEVDNLWKPHTGDIYSTAPIPVSECALYSETTLTYQIPDDKEHKFRCRAGVNVEYSVETTINGEVSVQLKSSVTPSVLIDGETKSLRIRCSLEGNASQVYIEFIKLDFRNPSTSTRVLAEIIGTSVSIEGPTLTSRANVSGLIDTNRNVSFLALDVGNVSCSDVGFYNCRTKIQGDETQKMEKETEFVGQSDPEIPAVRHEPVKLKYPVGEEVTIICSGKVGKPAKDWNWQEYDDDQKIWKPYTTGVSSDPPTLVNGCAYSGTSRLKYGVSDDKEHKFRCTVGSNVVYSVETTVNGEVSGASFQQRISQILLFCTVLYTIFE